MGRRLLSGLSDGEGVDDGPAGEVVGDDEGTIVAVGAGVGVDVVPATGVGEAAALKGGSPAIAATPA